jgi:hypothetical protein
VTIEYPALESVWREGGLRRCAPGGLNARLHLADAGQAIGHPCREANAPSYNDRVGAGCLERGTGGKEPKSAHFAGGNSACEAALEPVLRQISMPLSAISMPLLFCLLPPASRLVASAHSVVLAGCLDTPPACCLAA